MIWLWLSYTLGTLFSIGAGLLIFFGQGMLLWHVFYCTCAAIGVLTIIVLVSLAIWFLHHVITEFGP